MSNNSSAVAETFALSGMHCASCAVNIDYALEELPGVISAIASYATEKVKITYDPAQVGIPEFSEAIGKLGYTITPATQSHEHHSEVATKEEDHSLHAGHDMMTPVSSDQRVKEQKLAELAQLKHHTKVVLPMAGLSVAMMVFELGAAYLKWWSPMPEIWMDFFHHLFPILATYVLFVIGKPYLQGVGRFLRYRVANMDTLVGIGTSVAYLYSFILTAFEEALAPYLDTSVQYYDVTIVVIAFITLGKFLEGRSKLQTGEAIEKLLDLQVKQAIVLRGGQQLTIPVDQVVMGDTLLVKPGQQIPLDGVVARGESSVDESMITGESLPRDKVAGDSVIGATLNKHGSLEITVTKVGSDTMLSHIIRMVEEAQGSKAPIERLADQVSAYFVPTVLILSLLTFLVWMMVGAQFMPVTEALTLGILSLVGILVIACPCAMGLATPTAIIVGVGKAAQAGIMIKNAENLEKSSHINYVVLDKTGTLTEGVPSITDVHPVGSSTPRQAMQILASLESHSEHPLAQAALKRAKTEKLSLLKVDKFKALAGMGLQGVIKGTQYYVGNLALAKELGQSIDDSLVATLTAEGKTPVLLMDKKKILAYLGMSDTLKKEAQEVVRKLHDQGITVAMLTGDNQAAAQYIARQVGIDQVIAEVLPGDKAAEVQKLQKAGHTVAMVGDGINDAPALATADVGIAMGSGTDVAIESAGITLLGGAIAKLPKAIYLARTTMKVVKQNLFWAFFYNVVGIPVAAGLLYPFFGIMLNPAIAGAAMAFSSVSVVLNSLRLKRVRV